MLPLACASPFQGCQVVFAVEDFPKQDPELLIGSPVRSPSPLATLHVQRPCATGHMSERRVDQFSAPAFLHGSPCLRPTIAAHSVKRHGKPQQQFWVLRHPSGPVRCCMLQKEEDPPSVLFNMLLRDGLRDGAYNRSSLRRGCVNVKGDVYWV